MSHGILRRATAILTAAMLLVQLVAPLSAACHCEGQAPEENASCCQAKVSAADCRSEPKCCSTNRQCGNAEAKSRSKCGCGCGDFSEREPFAPVEKSEQNTCDVKLLIHDSLAADTAALLPKQRYALASTPHACFTSNSVQALLCVWQN